MNDCKVVYGSCAMGFKDITGPMSYELCVQYLRDHENGVAVAEDWQNDPHYTETLDIMNVETGRLMSWSL